MKTLLLAARSRSRLVTPLGLIILATLAVAFWMSTSSSGLAQEPQCSVCHKRTQTLTFPCNTLDYQRHLDHGDPMNACAVTPTLNP